MAIRPKTDGKQMLRACKDKAKVCGRRSATRLYNDPSVPYEDAPIPTGDVVDPGLIQHIAAWKETELVNGDRLALVNDFGITGTQDLVQSTAANKPRFDTNIINGQSAFWFDGLAYWMECPAFMSGSVAEMYWVMRIPTPAGQQFAGWMKYNGAVQADHCAFSGTCYSSLGGTARMSYTPSPAWGTLDVTVIMHLVIQTGSGNCKWYENGAVLKQTNTQTIDWGTARHLVGGSSDSSNAASITHFLYGWVAEMKLYNQIRTTEQRNAEYAAFQSRYGTAYTPF